ncbi:MAG: MBL fold metallo-hydrolase [Clostridiales bacterium]|nr:MBL fold metallo-hydrolase [Clostridiales bacterium]
MLITYHGHSEFLLETEGGLRILLDPFNPDIPFAYREVEADIVTCSHDHADHNHIQKVKGHPIVINELGFHSPADEVGITGYPSFHDDVQGAKRGKNTIYLIQIEGLRIVHLGDLGALPDEKTLQMLKSADVLLIPVGGTYTIAAPEAAALAKRLNARITIPMHYKKGTQGLQNISSAEGFIQAMLPLIPSQQPLLRITHQDIGEAPRLVLLDVSH